MFTDNYCLGNGVIKQTVIMKLQRWQDDKWNKAAGYNLYDVGHIAQQCGRGRAGIAMECMSSEARGNT